MAAFAYRCDFYLRDPNRQLPWLYSSVVVVGYMMGLVAINFIMKITESEHPALLTLTPFTLVPLVIAAVIRKELGAMWRGSGSLEPKLPVDNEQEIPI